MNEIRRRPVAENPSIFLQAETITDLMMIRKMVEHRLRGSLNVGVAVELVEPGSLPRFEGKSKKVVDRRSL